MTVQCSQRRMVVLGDKMKRTNTAVWREEYKHWRLNVQKDGVRKSFYSSTPGRTGQRECNKKADRWLDEGLVSSGTKVQVLFGQWLDELKISTGRSHWSQYEGYSRIWITPKIGQIKMEQLNEQHLQSVINHGYQKGLSKRPYST